MTKKVTKRRFFKGEKMLYVLIGIAVFLFPVSIVFTKAVLSESNIDLEQLRSEISKQEGINESLSMQVDELASLDKIQSVATEKGMSYNNDNIKNIDH